jgi:hypothetical protein
MTNDIKPGDWVEGTALGGIMDYRMKGIFISTYGKWAVVAYYDTVGKIRRKKYKRLHNYKKVDGKPDKALLSFAKKHDMWREDMKENIINKIDNFLNEKEEKADIKVKIMDFLKKNPNPEDSKVHTFADDNNIEPDKLEANIYSILTSFLSNGRFNESGMSEDDIDKKELEMGIKVEAEHTNYPAMARRIAMDHLAEFPDYYTRLKKMEDDAKKAHGIEE